MFLICRKYFQFPIKSKNELLKPSHIYSISSLISFIAYSTYCLCKIIDPVKFIVGSRDPSTFAVTLGFCIYYVSAPAAMSGLVLKLGTFLLGYSKIMSPEIRERLTKHISFINFHIMPFLFLLGIIGSIIILLVFKYPNYAIYLYFTSISCNIFIFISYVTITFYYYQLVLSEMNKYIKQLNYDNNITILTNINEIKKVYNRLSSSKTLFLTMNIFALPICLLFICNIYFLRKFNYFFLSFFMLFHLFTVITLLISRKNKNIQLNLKRKQSIKNFNNLNSVLTNNNNNNTNNQLIIFNLSSPPMEFYKYIRNNLSISSNNSNKVGPSIEIGSVGLANSMIGNNNNNNNHSNKSGKLEVWKEDNYSMPMKYINENDSFEKLNKEKEKENLEIDHL